MLEVQRSIDAQIQTFTAAAASDTPATPPAPTLTPPPPPPLLPDAITQLYDQIQTLMGGANITDDEGAKTKQKQDFERILNSILAPTPSPPGSYAPAGQTGDNGASVRVSPY